ncbi:MAG: LamG domain-containing protein, partial [Proteobacteria bacterium]|nr:LamG domain-containing protein [Pseudomonadota bacterium]
TWTHVVCAWSPQGLTIYVNGVAEATDTVVESVLDTNAGDHTIGARDKSGTLSQYYTGTLDEVRVYDLTLTATQVQDLYNSVTPGGGAAAVDAGPDTTIRLPTDSVALNGSVSGNVDPGSIAWRVVSGAPGVAFADAGAPATSATFPAPGSYVLELGAEQGGVPVTDTASVTVEEAAVLSAIAVSPATVTLAEGATQPFSASGIDQYGEPYPTSIAWSATGGSIDQAGTYTAGTAPGSFTVTAAGAAVSGQAAVTVTSAALTPNAAHWQLDEGTGTSVSDAVGSNSGTVVGAAWSAGIDGHALDFDGTNDYVHVSDSAALDFSGFSGASVALWAKPGQLGAADEQTLYGHWNASGMHRPFQVLLGTDNRWQCRSNHSDGIATSASSAVLDTWTHVVCAWSPQGLTIYVNGVAEATDTVVESVLDTNAGDHTIGARDK